MLKYKKGDKVKVRPDLKVGKCGCDTVVEAMLGYRGKVTSVIKINDYTNDKYRLDGCSNWWFTDEMLMPAAPTIQEIKEKKVDCVISVDSKEDAVTLSRFLGDSRDVKYAEERYSDITRLIKIGRTHFDDTPYEGRVCFIITRGKISGFCDEGYYLKRSSYGEIYNFSDITASGGIVPFKKFKVGDKVIANGKSLYAITCEGWVGRVVKTDIDNGFGDDIKVESMDDDDVFTVKSKYFDHYDALDAVVSALDRAFEEQEKRIKEDNHMTFTTTKGERYTSLGKHKGKTIPTITTTVNINGRTGSATCDEADYNERDGILNAIASAYCYGNFDKVYRKAVKEQEKQKKLACTCGFCGEVLESPEAKAAHEAWHVERKKAKHERYLLRKEAKRRLAEVEREGKIEQVMKELCKK